MLNLFSERSRPGHRRGIAVACAMGAISLLPTWVGSASAVDPVPRCFVNGGGSVDGDSFGGQAAAYRARSAGDDVAVKGEWTHISADGRTFRGDIDQLACRRNGGHAEPPRVEFSIFDFSGTGTFDGQDVTFTVNGQDHGEPPNSDTYRIVISDPDDESIIYTSGGLLDSGNLQIHAANPGHP